MNILKCKESTVITESVGETRKLGARIAKKLDPGKVVCLIGELGTGKTSLTQGIARGLGIKNWLTSPTFIIINEYKGKLPLYHFDLYRLGREEELLDLGYEEYFYGEGVTVIEWAEKIRPLWPENRVEIYLESVSKNTRRIKIVR
jgi:tRNA threonylcarbamoyladenosine biosynthesis protein TsaE